MLVRCELTPMNPVHRASDAGGVRHGAPEWPDRCSALYRGSGSIQDASTPLGGHIEPLSQMVGHDDRPPASRSGAEDQCRGGRIVVFGQGQRGKQHDAVVWLVGVAAVDATYREALDQLAPRLEVSALEKCERSRALCENGSWGNTRANSIQEAGVDLVLELAEVHHPAAHAGAVATDSNDLGEFVGRQVTSDLLERGKPATPSFGPTEGGRPADDGRSRRSPRSSSSHVHVGRSPDRSAIPPICEGAPLPGSVAQHPRPHCRSGSSARAARYGPQRARDDRSLAGVVVRRER